MPGLGLGFLSHGNFIVFALLSGRSKAFSQSYCQFSCRASNMWLTFLYVLFILTGDLTFHTCLEKHLSRLAYQLKTLSKWPLHCRPSTIPVDTLLSWTQSFHTEYPAHPTRWGHRSSTQNPSTDCRAGETDSCQYQYHTSMARAHPGVLKWAR